MKHPYFINPMIYLPLVLLGAEKILNKQKPYLFISMVFISSISNFYFLYVIILMIIIYVLIRYYTLYRKEKITYFINMMLKFLFYGITGILLSAVILLPVINLFLSDVRGNVSYDIGIFYKIKYYVKLLISMSSFRNTENWSFLGYTPIAIICIILLFVDRKEKTEDKKALKIGLILLTIFLMFPIFGHVLNGFSYITNRWVWAYSFVISVIIASMWNKIFSIEDKNKKILIISLLIYTILYFIASSVLQRAKMKYVFTIMLVIYLGIILIKTKNIKLKNMLMICAILVSITLNAMYNYKILGYTRHFIKSGNVENLLKDKSSSGVLKDFVDQEKENEEFFRYSEALTNKYYYNDSIVNCLNGTGYYFSLQNGYISKYLYEMNNLEYRTNYKYRTLDERTALNELASVKYFVKQTYKIKNKKLRKKYKKMGVITKSGNVPYGYVKKDEITRGKIKYNIYENKYMLPLGYSYNNYILRDEYEKLSSVERSEALLKSILLEKEVSDYNKGNINLDTKKIDYEIINKNKNIKINNNEINVSKKNTEIELKFNGIENSEIYLEFLKLNFEGKGKNYNKSNRPLLYIKTDNVTKKLEYHDSEYQFYNGRKDYTINLGYYQKKKDSVKIQFVEKGTYKFDELNLIFQPMNNYEKNVNKLKEVTLDNVNISTNHVSGTIDANEDKILCFSIPYNGGWTAKIDDKDEEVYRANSAYMAVKVKKGKHKIDLYYTTPFLKTGAILSCIGLIIVFIIIIYNRIKKNKDLSNIRLLKS